MRYIFLIFISLLMLVSAGQAKDFVSDINSPSDTTKNKIAAKKISKDEKWNIFWKDFTSAINAKDKNKITALTSKDFYDGGGGTVEQWLDAEVFLNDKSFNTFKSILKKGVKNYRGYEGNPYKATGRNRSGDLFFEYKNAQWLFGGVVGD